ncbi:MAG: LON peptidase substrate-binding domain-containing protein [Candidatus Binataceae bacterium]
MTTSHEPHKRLPKNPSEENLRKQAKRLAKLEGLQLAAAQRRLAIDYGYRNWAELMQVVAARSVPLLPLRELIAFPHETYPIFIGRGRSIRAVEAVAAGKTPILLVAQRDAMVAAPSPADMYEIGTLGVMVEWVRRTDGTIKALIEGKKRVRVVRYVLDEEFFKAEAEEVDEPAGHPTGLETLIDSVRSTFEAHARRTGKIPPEILGSIGAIDDPSILSDKMVGHLSIRLAEKQALLECINPVERLEKILGYLQAAN